ncbi:MAG: hypothetical protein FWD74_05375, partial [Actinomycetia bacterium]|nr:hypothetical protein [Actinomycetes bacterium]
MPGPPKPGLPRPGPPRPGPPALTPPVGRADGLGTDDGSDRLGTDGGSDGLADPVGLSAERAPPLSGCDPVALMAALMVA